MVISSAQEIIEEIRQGKMVILMDDEDRENEGDLIIAAEHVTPEIINFMATHGRGLICLTLSKARCKTLGLGPMVQDNGAQFSTAFTASIEAAHGVTTGISAADRATTILAAVAKNAQACDVVQPGHIFPLMAQNGGVLTRAGHTEAGCDLARLAGFEPASVIVEILNDDGTMARRPDLELFAQKHGLKLGTIADLIEYRNLHESTIERVEKCQLTTEFGQFELITYRDVVEDQLHYALQRGEINEQPTLVRVHVHDLFGDILHSQREISSHWSIAQAIQKVATEGGVVVILTRPESNDFIINKLRRFAAQDNQQSVAPLAGNKQRASRSIGIGSQILADLGVRKMRLLVSSDKHYHALAGFGLDVVEYIVKSESQ